MSIKIIIITLHSVGWRRQHTDSYLVFELVLRVGLKIGSYYGEQECDQNIPQQSAHQIVGDSTLSAKLIALGWLQRSVQVEKVQSVKLSVMNFNAHHNFIWSSKIIPVYYNLDVILVVLNITVVGETLL